MTGGGIADGLNRAIKTKSESRIGERQRTHPDLGLSRALRWHQLVLRLRVEISSIVALMQLT